jgi:molecular chaperone GrpE
MLEAGEAARADLSRRLLEIIDDLTRVAEAPCDPEQHQAMHDGVGLIARKLLKTLGEVGMEPVNPEGERFDPNFHEALTLTPTDDPDLDEHVSHVMLIGYRLADRLLRAAQVAVYRYEEGE